MISFLFVALIGILYADPWSFIKWNNKAAYIKSDNLRDCEQNIFWSKCKSIKAYSEIKSGPCPSDKSIDYLEKDQLVELLGSEEQRCGDEKIRIASAHHECGDQITPKTSYCLDLGKNNDNINKIVLSIVAPYLWSDKISSDDKNKIKDYYANKWPLALSDSSNCVCSIRNAANIYCNLYKSPETKNLVDKMLTEVKVDVEGNDFSVDKTAKKIFDFVSNKWGTETSECVENVEPKFSKIFLNSFMCPAPDDLTSLVTYYLNKDKEENEKAQGMSKISIVLISVGTFVFASIVFIVVFYRNKKSRDTEGEQGEWITGGPAK